MQEIEAHVGAGGYELKSELARICLPAPQAHVQRHLAWTNSICLLFLLIGLAGARIAPPAPIPVQPLEEAVPVILEAPPPPPATLDDQKPADQPDQDKPSTPQVVVAVPNSPAINFSVPTVSARVVPNALYVVPPPVAAPKPVVTPVRVEPKALGNTGEGGDRPEPRFYPKLAQDAHQQGDVTVLLTADEAGLIVSVEIKESSGSPILDRFTVEFIKRRWTVAPGARGRLFQTKFTYKLRQ